MHYYTKPFKQLEIGWQKHQSMEIHSTSNAFHDVLKRYFIQYTWGLKKTHSTQCQAEHGTLRSGPRQDFTIPLQNIVTCSGHEMWPEINVQILYAISCIEQESDQVKNILQQGYILSETPSHHLMPSFYRLLSPCFFFCQGSRRSSDIQIGTH